jgi:RNA polymerase sigma factor (sigma-70 family)
MPRTPRKALPPLTPEQQKLVEANIGLPLSIVEKFNYPPMYHDDMVSDAMLALVHAARSFKADKIGTFSAFSYLCIERRLASTYNKAHRNESRRASDTVGRDDVHAHEDNRGVSRAEQRMIICPATPEPDESLARKPERHRAFGDLGDKVARLPRLLRRVVYLHHREGMNLHAIGAKLGIRMGEVRERLEIAHWLLRLRMSPPQPERAWSDEEEVRAVQVAATRGRDARQMAALRMSYDANRDYLEVVALARSVRGRVRKRSKANHMAST